LAAGVAVFTCVVSTVAPAAEGGTVERIKVHSEAVAGNLQGNSADRDVLVYLPPSYRTEPNRRYPVVYQLHGWLPSAEQWAGMIKLQEGTDRAIASGNAREMIVVLPDTITVHEGSMYSSSVTTGDFEAFVARDLVAYIDAHYRTLAVRASRGLSGHSMGGYGTLRIGMKYPELYDSIYAMSSCCLSPRTFDQGLVEASKITSLEEAEKAGIGPRVSLSLAAAWSPNPNNPPFFFDFPVKDGQEQPLVLAKWAANAPLAMVDQYITSFRTYDGIALEVGLQDGLLRDNQDLADVLTTYGVEHTYETYEGNHTNKVAERYEERVLPFFSKRLAFDAADR
jgi:enterochelin esterase-like enzyme